MGFWNDGTTLGHGKGYKLLGSVQQLGPQVKKSAVTILLLYESRLKLTYDDVCMREPDGAHRYWSKRQRQGQIVCQIRHSVRFYRPGS